MAQGPAEVFSLMSQQLMLDIILNLEKGRDLDINALRMNAPQFAAKITKDEEYDKVRDELKAKCLVAPKQAAPASAKPAAPAESGSQPAEHAEHEHDHVKKPAEAKK
jgi:hypothetical protein